MKCPSVLSKSGGTAVNHEGGKLTTKHIAIFVLGMVVTLYCLDLLQAQEEQQADRAFTFAIDAPTYPDQNGPRVGIDEAHNNYHTLGGRYRAFGELLARDGFRVSASTGEFDNRAVRDFDILVISNAIHHSNVEDYSLPNPSAFTPGEIDVLLQWVREGGSLWLIADHQPMAGAAADLAEALGVLFMNGYAMKRGGEWGRHSFRRDEGGLLDHPIVHGRNSVERIPSVFGFTGQAFHLAPGTQGSPVMVLNAAFDLYIPHSGLPPMTAATPKIPVTGLLQGATLKLGRGRVAVFGEAGMFTAQLMGPGQTAKGFNDPRARHNMQFTLNVAHWLAGVLDPE
jgi:hypothetical protein